MKGVKHHQLQPFDMAEETKKENRLGLTDFTSCKIHYFTTKKNDHGENDGDRDLKVLLVKHDKQVLLLLTAGQVCWTLCVKQPGFKPWLGHCVVLLGKTLYSHTAFLHQAVEMTGGGVGVLLKISERGGLPGFLKL